MLMVCSLYMFLLSFSPFFSLIEFRFTIYFSLSYHFSLSHLIGRAQQHPRGGMAGGIRGYFGSRTDGAVQLNPRSSTPIPDHDNYTRPGLPFGVKLDEYINKAADAQSEPGHPRGFRISN